MGLSGESETSPDHEIQQTSSQVDAATGEIAWIFSFHNKSPSLPLSIHNACDFLFLFFCCYYHSALTSRAFLFNIEIYHNTNGLDSHITINTFIQITGSGQEGTFYYVPFIQETATGKEEMEVKMKLC